MSGEEEIAPVEEGNDHLSVTIHKQVQSSLASTSFEEKFNELVSSIDEADQKPKLKPLIQSVPFMLRDNKNFEKYYEPRAVSIGPLHHGKPKFKQSERLKGKLTALFIKENGLTEKDLYEKIKKEIASLRACYNEDEIKSFNDEGLSWVFFVDGCALLHYIDCVAEKKLNELKIKTYHAAFAGQDLFLLENQLPYQLLNILMDSCKPERQTALKKSIDEFIFETVKSIRGSKVQHKCQAEPEVHTHLLDLLRKRLIGMTAAEASGKTGWSLAAGEKRLLHCPSSFWKQPFSTLCQLHQSGNQPPQSGKQPQEDHQWYSFRNVNELMAAGIDLQPGKEVFLHHISFTSHWFRGTLTLSPIIVDDATAPRFLNLIAYEMCPDFDNDFEITSYISFLDSLIDQPSDVKELRKAQILHNLLGSDEEVAKLFNEIGVDLVPNPEAYENIRQDIQNHYKKIWKTWCSQFLHEHFSSPWTGLAFCGAIAALLLSALQTVYSMKQYWNSCS